MKNLHKAYYKDYFEGVNFEYLLGKKNKTANTQTIERIKRTNANVFIANHCIGNNHAVCFPIQKLSEDFQQTFDLKIAYPGLVTGVGINHEANIEGEFKLGVHFDYTYGMPVVYGSSVKGVLRSAFKQRGFIDENFIADVNQKLTKDHIDASWFVENLKLIEEDIFEGTNKGKPKSIYNRDIFFDAVLTHGDAKGRILCSDSITPHRANPLKNPIPITFMKIAPGCRMEFRFKLVDTKLVNIDNDRHLTINQKLCLFKEILRTEGVGAKTNVGYGQFE